MVEILEAETEKPNQTEDLFWRKIVFVPAKKPYKGFSNDFHMETLNPTITEPRSGTSLAVSKKGDVTEFSEYDFDPDLNFGTTVRRIGAGLLNLGNTCYLNSVLQCLTYTEPLAAYLQSGKHKSSCHVAGFCALCAIQNHVSRTLQSSGRILVPEVLFRNLRCISRNFRYARQEDAHDYMLKLLESMHKCCLPPGVPIESPGAYEKSLVYNIFGGSLRSQVTCLQCLTCPPTKSDRFLDLSLEIFKADSLQKALTNFTAAELLDGGERQYHCQCCKQKVRALKQLTIEKAPKVLLIHLKRFHALDPEKKIQKKVNFGYTLDLKPFVSGDSNDRDAKYSLSSVLVHSGSTTSNGHYFCYVRTANNMWYTLNDNHVSHVGEQHVLNQQAYILFYVRDKKSISPRKFVNVLSRNKDSSPSSNVWKEYPNGHSENKYEALPSLDHSGKDNNIFDNMKCLASPIVDKAIMLYTNGISKDSVRKVNTSAAEEDSITDLSKSTIPITPLIQPNLIDKVGTCATSVVDEKACIEMCESSLNQPVITECVDQKQVKKSRKKFLKYLAVGTQLRSNPLFRGYIGPRKKKNCKRSKHRMLDSKHISRSSVINEFESGQASSLQDVKSKMLTQEETVVSRWDDIELPSSQSLELKNDKIVSIGNVGDEWDEEYDTGKRKKIRGLKHNIEGPNLFQQIATQKSKFKRTRLDQSNSGNPSFRI